MLICVDTPGACVEMWITAATGCPYGRDQTINLVVIGAAIPEQ